nr:hypothetical protein [Candidatus Sigynarchaeota archaeon]
MGKKKKLDDFAKQKPPAEEPEEVGSTPSQENDKELAKKAPATPHQEEKMEQPAPVENSDMGNGEDAVTASEGEDLLQKALASGDVTDIKFWQKNDYFKSLLDPEIIKKLDLTSYDLAKLLNEFFNEMFKRDFIDFKVSGIAVHSAAKIYRWKITEVLEQQEKELEEQRKEALKRAIPSSISQPLRAGRQIATQEDFMQSMRSAIIEVMRKREKQAIKIAKSRGEGASSEEHKRARMRKTLPESIRKALLGKERIEDTFQRWLEIIYKKIKENPDKRASYFTDLKPVIEKTDKYKFRFEHARLFLSLMFLRNRGKIDLDQGEELSDIFVLKMRETHDSEDKVKSSG